MDGSTVSLVGPSIDHDRRDWRNRFRADPLCKLRVQVVVAMAKEKLVLDPCCGSRMFYFYREDSRALFTDCRTVENEEFSPNRFITVSRPKGLRSAFAFYAQVEL